MPVPSKMSLEKIPAPRHPRVRVAYAAAWQALIDTHAAQAVQFIREFALRLATLQGLQLYLHVAAVPESMQESVWTAALTALDLGALPPPVEPQRIQGWRRLRIDLVLDSLREQKRQESRTMELARMAGARAAEAMVTTHVDNVLTFARLLADVMPVGDVLELYLANFRLPESPAQMVSQRVRAAVIGEQLLADLPAALPAECSDLGYTSALSDALPDPTLDAVS